ncbi:MAG: YbaB/EbfC family nucleoid-associated protein [Lentisphaeria bacterium]|nr:YbaB/EbfC family nucleoid-associated protein [Lentisphaeria bacterium]
MSMLGDLSGMAGLMKKFGELQKNMKQVREELPQIEVTGADSKETVEVRVSGDFALRSIRISPALAASGNAEALQNAVFEAVNQALAQAKAESAKKISEAAGGLPIPGLTP